MSQRSPIGHKDGGGNFESCRGPCRTPAAIFIAKAGVAGKPVLVRRVSYRTRVFSLARERVYLNPWACEREVRPARRHESVDEGIENAFAAAWANRCLPGLYAEMASCILGPTDARWTRVGVSVIDNVGVGSDGKSNSCCVSNLHATDYGT